MDDAFFISRIQALETELFYLKQKLLEFGSGEFNVIQKGGIINVRRERILVKITGFNNVNKRYSWVAAEEDSNGVITDMVDPKGFENAIEINGLVIPIGTYVYLNPSPLDSQIWLIDEAGANNVGVAACTPIITAIDWVNCVYTVKYLRGNFTVNDTPC